MDHFITIIFAAFCTLLTLSGVGLTTYIAHLRREVRLARAKEERRRDAERLEREKREKRMAEAKEALAKLMPRGFVLHVHSIEEYVRTEIAMGFARNIVCRALDVLQGTPCDGVGCERNFRELIARVRGNRPDTQPWTSADTRQLVEASLRFALEQLESSSIGKES